MRSKLIISANGIDRKGIVSEISSIISQNNGNIETSKMIGLETEFALLVLIDIDNDKIETLAIKNVFKQEFDDLFVSSSKSMLGHLLGAAGAVEAIITIKALQSGILPPTINYNTPDPDCDLNYIPNKAIEKKINYALSNAFGFGGHNASLLFKKFN